MCCRNWIIGLAITVFLPSVGWAKEPLKSEYKVDIDGDGFADTFAYTLRAGSPHQASLRIKTAKGAVLWDHIWTIQPDDLNILMEEEGRKNAAEWVKLFFENRHIGGTTYAREKLTDQDLVDEYITFSAEQLGLSPETLKTYILSQKINHTFQYRAEWREDLYVIVYVPQLKLFVPFTGYGE